MTDSRAGYALGIDIGGTKIAGGVVAADGTVLARARALTPDRSTSPGVVEDIIVGVASDLLAQVRRSEVVAVGIGAAGFVCADRATVVFSPHLSWRHEPLREALARRIEVPIVIDNDANAAGWAESRFGAARDESHAVALTVGTGIGGAILLEGAVVRGRFGIAGEFGHMRLVPGGHRCECGNRGCWEQYASGNALVRGAKGLMYAGSLDARDLLDRVGGDPERLSGPLVTEAAQEGDRAALGLLADVGDWLGIGMATLAAALDPGMFVIGGGVSAAGELLLGPARSSFRRHLVGRGHRPEAAIVLASLGNDAGLIGAADLARNAVEGRG